MLKFNLYSLAQATMIGAVALIVAPTVYSETVSVAPVGEYAQIDVHLANETVAALTKGAADEKQKAIERVKTAPERYAPPVFYAMSQALFLDGKQDEGAFWFYAGQLRARFDANRCLDSSARSAVGALNQQYGPAINRYMFADVAKLEALIPQVVEWDRKTAHNYDHRWINLHGMSAMLPSLGGETEAGTLSAPKAQWAEIEEKTRSDYLIGFKKALTQMKK